MRSNGGEDAQSNPPPRMRDPLDHAWGRLSVLGNTFDCYERDGCKSSKIDWVADVRPSSPRSSSEILFSDIGSLPLYKRKAPGRRSARYENGTNGSPVSRSLNKPLHGKLSAENSKGGDDLFDSACVPTGNSSSLIMQKPGDKSDGIQGRLDRSSRYNLPTPPYGTNRTCRGPVLWEQVRSTLSAQEVFFRDEEKYWARHGYHRRTYSLPKLSSPGEWGGGEAELLEGRIGRYGSTACRDSTISNGKQVWCDWSTRNTLFGGNSSNSPFTSLCNSKLKDVNTSLAHWVDPRALSPPYHDEDKNSFFNQDNRDFDAGPASPKKRRRLTWGQGLAQYEKEKDEKNHSDSKKFEHGHLRIVGSHEDVHSSLNGHSQAMENGSILSLKNQRCGCKRNSDVLSSRGFEGSFSSKSSTASQSLFIPVQHAECQGKEITRKSSPSAGITENLSFQETSLQSPVLNGVKEFLLSFCKEKPALSMDVLGYHMEKVELEIDRVEEELVKLGTYKVEGFANMHEDETWNVAAFATESQLMNCEDSSAPMAASIVDMSVAHCSDTHVQLQEASGCSQMFLETANFSESDIDSNETVDSVSDHDLPLSQTSDLKSKSGVEPALEMTLSDTKLSSEESILLENAQKAQKSSSSLAHLNSCKFSVVLEPGRLYPNPQQPDVWILNVENHFSKWKHFENRILEHRASLKFVEKVLASKFMTHKVLWKQNQRERYIGVEGVEQSTIMEDEDGGDVDSLPLRSFGSRSMSDSKNKETLLGKMVNISPCSGQSRNFLKMPAMLLGRERDLCKVKAKNGLVDDPVSAEQERKILNPWSKEEKNLFLEKYYVLGKDFRRISSYLEHKTVADCVEFYYRNQKSEIFQKAHRKRLLEKACRFQLEKYRAEQALFYLGSNFYMDDKIFEDQRTPHWLPQSLLHCVHSVDVSTAI